MKMTRIVTANLLQCLMILYPIKEKPKNKRGFTMLGILGCLKAIPTPTRYLMLIKFMPHVEMCLPLEVVLFYISYAMEPCPRHAAVAEPAPAHATTLILHYYKNDFTRHCPNINLGGHKIQPPHKMPDD